MILLTISIINGILLSYLIATVVATKKKSEKEFSKDELMKRRATVLGHLQNIKEELLYIKKELKK